MYTSHGHQIKGTDVELKPEGLKSIGCGGEEHCAVCIAEGQEARTTLDRVWQSEQATAIKDALHKNRYPTAGPFMSAAMEHVYAFVRERLDKTDHVEFDITMVYIVWFSKTLQNWKAMVSTALPDGKYYEVTYDGEKDRMYIDGYVKFQNVVVEMSGKRPDA